MKKQVFYLREPERDPFQVKSDTRVSLYNPSEHLIIWTVRLYDHVLLMPELTLLVQDFYCFN